MIEAASDERIPDPRLCKLEAWGGNVRAYLEYLCQCDIAMIEEQGGNRILTDALRRIIASLEFLPDFMAAEFESKMRDEPFAIRILTHTLSDLQAIIQMADAADLIQYFQKKFPRADAKV